MKNKKTISLLLSLLFSFPNLSQAGSTEKCCLLFTTIKGEKNREESHSEEKENALNDYFDYLSKVRKQFPPLSQDKNEALIRQFRKTGDIEIQNKIVSHNMDLVARVIKKYRWAVSPVVDRMDLIQEGSLGLIKALSVYEPGRARFSNFASIYIEKFIQKFVFDQAHIVKIKTSNPPVEDVAIVKISIEKLIENLIDIFYRLSLSERDKRIFIQYALNSSNPSLSQARLMYDISEQRVRQIINQIKIRIRRYIHMKKLDDEILKLLFNDVKLTKDDRGLYLNTKKEQAQRKKERKEIMRLIDIYMGATYGNTFHEYMLQRKPELEKAKEKVLIEGLAKEVEAKAKARVKQKVLIERLAKEEAEAKARAKVIAKVAAKEEAEAKAKEAKVIAKAIAKAEAKARAKVIAKVIAKAEKEEEAIAIAKEAKAIAKAEAKARAKVIAKVIAKAEKAEAIANALEAIAIADGKIDSLEEISKL